MKLFISIVLTTWSAMHLYVFWRLASIPRVTACLSGRGLIVLAVILWASYPVARILNWQNVETIARPLEFAGANWIGILFLLFAAILVVEVITLGGWLMPAMAPRLRAGAVLAACLLSIVGMAQGLRAPVVRNYEVHLAGLPPERDGLVIVEISDLHLGTLINRGWAARQIQRVNELRPDAVVVVGDIVDANLRRVEPFQSVLATLRAPLGVWAVTGNHEYYAGAEQCVSLFRSAGFSVLRDAWAEVTPGLVFAGVDDLTVRRQYGGDGAAVRSSLANRPQGATILLSHSPMQAEEASALGTGLMLSGHTHDGQIWPFNYLVRLRYPLLAGRYEVGGMTAIVCRGTGTWGPRMRLWRPAEIVRITLRSTAKSRPPGTSSS